MTQPENEHQLPLFDDNPDHRMSGNTPELSVAPFSKYIVYVDESGDHGMQSVDENYPLFVLAFCVFHKQHYSEKVVAALETFKFRHFGHDLIVLHESEIRKEKGVFTFFRSREEKQDFLEGLTNIVERSNFVLIACIIDKRSLQKEAEIDSNPYHLALSFCVETLYGFLKEKNQHTHKTHVVVECRGKKEDRELELEFRRICDGANRLDISLPFDIIFADKKTMSSGLQLADLVARPIGMSFLRPFQANRAFEVLKYKFYCEGGRKNVGKGYENMGLKIYPGPKSEKPR